MTTEKTLRKWRKEALEDVSSDYCFGTETNARKKMVKVQQRILRLTQEQLDQHLMRKGGTHDKR